MADINNINSLQDLLDVIDAYLVSPRNPPLKAEEIGKIIKKVIQFTPGTGSTIITPNPPTNGIVNDDANTFTFTLSVI